MLTSITNEEVELIFEKELLRVKTKNIKGKLKVAFRENKEEELQKTETQKIVNIKDFLSGISFCSPAACIDLTTKAMCGVRCTDTLVLSSDRYKIFTWIKDSYVDQKLQYTLPTTLVDALYKFKNEINSIHLNVIEKTKEVVSLSVSLNDSTVLQGKTIKGNYQDLVKYFPNKDVEHIDIPINDDFIQSVGRLTDFLSNLLSPNKEMFVSIAGDQCELSVCNNDYGKIVEEVFLPIPESTFTCSFCVNPTLIIDALNTISGECPRISFYPSLRLLVIESDQCKCCMPTRVTVEKKETEKDSNVK